jgi:hypothetical protein
MHKCVGSGPLIAASGGDSHQLIAADLRALIAQIETSMHLIEAMMSRADSGDETGSTDVVVLDDVTPRYVTASAALGACRIRLDLALQCLSESGNSAEPGSAAERRPSLIA